MPVYAKPRTAARLYCPVNFWPKEDCADGMIYLCHVIITTCALDPRYRKGKNDGFVPLKGEYMRNVLGHHNWSVVRQFALDSGLVLCDESYSVGRRSKGYKLREPYRSARWKLRDIHDQRLAQRIKEWRASDRRRIWEEICNGNCPVGLDVCEHLHRHLRRIRIDEQINEELTNMTEIAVEMIRRAEWRLDVDNYGRVHTNITNLKRSLRRLLSVDGRRLVNCDIANSQPLFVGAHFCSQPERGRRPEERGEEEGRRKGKRGRGKGRQNICRARLGSLGNVAKDLGRFIEICGQGGFYEFIESRVPHAPERNVLKRQVLATLYDKDSHRNAIYRVLEKEFPTLMHGIRLVKREDYRHLAHLAQRTESEFIMGRCVKRLLVEHPDLFITTIHDSIMTTQGGEEVVRGIMLEEFERLNIHATVRIEP